MISGSFGGDKRDRTADLLNAIQALSQLSYTPIFGSLFKQLLYYSTDGGNVKHFFRNLSQLGEFVEPGDGAAPMVEDPAVG